MSKNAAGDAAIVVSDGSSPVAGDSASLSAVDTARVSVLDSAETNDADTRVPNADGPADTLPDGAADGRATDGGAADLQGGVILPASATRFVAEEKGGGFRPAPPAGSTCPVGASLNTVVVATRAFSYRDCVSAGTATAPFMWKEGQRTLSETEYTSLTRAIGQMTPASRMICGADKPALIFTVTTPAGEMAYLDSFYSCQKLGNYVDGIDAVFTALRALPRQ